MQPRTVQFCHMFLCGTIVRAWHTCINQIKQAHSRCDRARVGQLPVGQQLPIFLARLSGVRGVLICPHLLLAFDNTFHCVTPCLHTDKDSSELFFTPVNTLQSIQPSIPDDMLRHERREREPHKHARIKAVQAPWAKVLRQQLGGIKSPGML